MIVSVAVIGFVYICTPITLYMGHMSFFNMFFNGYEFYPLTTAVIINGLWIDISINLVLDW